jgi:hypothetical protein
MNLNIIPLWLQKVSPEREDSEMWTPNEYEKLKFSPKHRGMLYNVAYGLFYGLNGLKVCRVASEPIDFYSKKKPKSIKESAMSLLMGTYSIDNLVHPFYKESYVVEFLKGIDQKLTQYRDSDVILFVSNFPVGVPMNGQLGGFKIDDKSSLVSAWMRDFDVWDVYKESLHELGHVFGLEDSKTNHSNEKCIMNVAEDFEKRDGWYCDICKDYLKKSGILLSEPESEELVAVI